MIIDLTGKVALITGAAQGIGAGTARRLAASGASVLIADIKDDLGENVAEKIRATGQQASFIHADVSDESQIRAMIDAAITRYGRLDVLINNAWAGANGSAVKLESKDWDFGMAVLLRALYLAAKYAVPHMQKQGGGNIINIGSVLGRFPRIANITYNTAKAAVVQLSRQLALEYGPDNIRVNVILPGGIENRPPYDTTPERDSIYSKLSPLGRQGMPSDIANAICFLVSEQASFITGTELVVDGGQTLPFYSDVIEAVLTYQKENKGE
jgi:NAD(P)-dependent dehydrogenase (short-subunit alcohol dehydrogenase family)